MRRKVLKDLANTFCQNYFDLTSGADSGAMAFYGSGRYIMDVLTGQCTANGRPISELKGCKHLREWFNARLMTHQIPILQVLEANLSVEVVVADLRFKKSYGHSMHSAHFDYACASKISTDEAEYTGSYKGEKVWGFGSDYDNLAVSAHGK